MPHHQIFSVGHGNYDRFFDTLTESGHEAAGVAGETLARIISERELDLPIILSADKPRNLEVAEDLAQAFNKDIEIVISHRLTLVGESPEAIQNLDSLVQTVLAEEGVDYGSETPFVIAADNVIPMLAEDRYSDLLHGSRLSGAEVVECDPDSWDKSRFKTAAHRMIEVTMSSLSPKNTSPTPYGVYV